MRQCISKAILFILCWFAMQAGAVFAHDAPDTVVFGPKQYLRTSGAPNQYTDTFNVPVTVGKPFQVHIVNGDTHGRRQVSSAWVTLNGVQIAGPNDFKRDGRHDCDDHDNRGHNNHDDCDQNEVIDRTVTLKSSNNKLTVKLSSTPGSYITISMLGKRIPTVPTGLAPNPITIRVGATGNLTATLAPVPTAAGSLSVSSANSSKATVPSSVPFAANQGSVAIPVRGVAVGHTTISARLNGTTANASVNVIASPLPPTITSLVPAALSVTQGATGTLTVTLSATQTASTQVQLTSTNANIASVPSTITVAAGQLSASVPVVASAPGSAQITASLNGSSASSEVTVTQIPPTVVSLLPAVSTVTLGANSSFTLAISAAQSTDTIVPLAVSPSGIVTAPTSVTVPAGQTSVAVQVAGVALGQATLTASLNGSTASAAANVVPPAPQLISLAPDVLAMNVGATSQFTVAINAAQLTNTDIALSVDNASALQIPATVTIAQGQTSAVFAVTGLDTGDAVITADLNNTQKTANVHVAPQPAAITSLLPSTLPLQAGATGSLVVAINVAQEADTLITLTTDTPAVVLIPASITIPAGQTSVGIPVNATIPGTAQITASVNGSSAVSSVTVTPPPPVVTAFAPTGMTLPRGTPGTFTVSVSRAPNAATAITLTSSDASIASVPPVVNIAAGALSADFPVVANSVGQVTITATLNGTTITANVSITAPELVALSLSPQSPTLYIDETQVFTTMGTMTDGSSEDFTNRVTWSSSAPEIASISSSGLANAVTAGQTNITASYTFTAAATSQSVTITQSTPLTIKAPVNLVLSVQDTTLRVGDSTTVTVTSSDPAPSQGLTVNLTASGSGSASFPQAIQIPASDTSATFTFTASAAGSLTLTATAFERLPGSLAFTIQPRLQITNISPASGVVGTIFTLTGSGFDTVGGNNQLVFPSINSTQAEANVVSVNADGTQLVGKVPPLADSGPIVLTNIYGSASSPNFTVTRDQDYQFIASPVAITVPQGSNSSVQLQLSSTGAKPLTGLVSLSVQGLPSGTTASFAPAATMSAFQTSTVTFGAAANAAPGNYTITLNATANESGQSFTRSTQINLAVLAAANVTGVKGRFINPGNQGIAGIIVRADIDPNTQPTTTTDAAGNFLLTGLPSGPVTLRFDATPANPLYPMWPVTITLGANQITQLPDWDLLPPPTIEKFTPIANATQPQQITDDRYPGLAVTLPPGVTITGWDGVVKTRIAIERIDPDKLGIPNPPVPTKSVYQLFFGTPMGGLPSAPIPVTHPNDLGLDPGQQTDLYYYDGSPMGGSGEWKKAGTGTVSADGKVIVSDPGTGIPRFCGKCGPSCFAANQNNALNPPCPSCGDGPAQSSPHPVNFATGMELPSETDIAISGFMPLEVSRTYHPRDAFDNIAGVTGSMGFGWAMSHDVALLQLGTVMRIVMPGNSRADFKSNGAGVFTVENDTRFYGAQLTHPGSLWQLKFKDGRIWNFSQNGALFFLSEQRDTNGNSLLIARNGSGKVQSVQSGQRSLAFSYGSNGFLNQVSDALGRTVSYTYNAQNRLATVIAPDNGVTSYTYVTDTEFPSTACTAVPGGQRIKTIQRPGQTALQTLFYGPGRRVLREVLEDGSESRFSYKLVGACVTNVATPAVKCTANCPDTDSWDNFQAGWRIVGGTIAATTYTDAGGHSSTQRFNGSGQGTELTDAQGQTATYTRDALNRVTAKTDALGRTWKYQYDANGNKTQVIDPLNRVTDMTYDAQWNKLASVTRYLEDNTPVKQQMVYDATTGNLTRSTDPLGNITNYAYTPRGQLRTLTLPDTRITTFDYNDDGDLISMTDPLGNQSHLSPDAVGRIATTSDALGFDTQSTYSPVDQLTRITDANQGVTQLNYDTKRNLSSVVNPLNATIESYQYDNLYRMTQRTDAKSKNTSYQYDANGNVTRLTDRKAQITTFGYDAQDRLTTLNYPGSITQTRTYDSVGRLSEIRENDNATAFAYDNADRVIKVTTDNAASHNEVGYAYDALDRVVSRTLNNTDPTTYAYDLASRLASISYRNQTTAYTWDTANRLTRKTLPDGILQNYTYDDANRVTQIQYVKPNATVIETLAYSYDANGNRLSKASGSASVQETPFTASYDTANRMTSLTLSASGQTFILNYDDNGNLISRTDPVNSSNTTTYTWDSRNRLAQIASPGLGASFKYDALGRRVSKTVNASTGLSTGSTTTYVYDGAQVMGEFSGGTLSATQLSGLAIDEVIARYSQTGNRTYLTDALGSAIALAGDDQTVQAYYAYTPYGETQVLGTDQGNPVQYTARENDQTGLYYYRARYYDPVLKRFISEDPIGLAGGGNVYTYVRGNPLSYVDPLGLFNYAKGAVAIANTIAAGISIGAGAASIVGGVGVAPTGVGVPVSAGAIAFGAWRINAGIAAARRAKQQWNEAKKECSSDASWDNALGLLPFGQNFDDSHESLDEYGQGVLNQPTSVKIIDILTYGPFGR